MTGNSDRHDGPGWIFTWPQVKAFVSKAANVCNMIASFGVIFAVGFFIYGQKDRETLEEASAWAALSNPKPGISVARQLEYLSRDGWFRSASGFDNIHLVPESGTSGVSLDGLVLKDVSLQNVKADKASLVDAKIEDSDLSMMSLNNAAIIGANLKNIMLMKSNISGSRIVNSSISGIFTGSSLVKSFFNGSEISVNTPTISVFNQENLAYDEYYRADFSRSFFRDSVLKIPADDRFHECGVLDLDAVELYYSSVEVSWKGEEFTQKCMLFMDRSWIVGSQVAGSLGWTCLQCTIAYSSMEIDVSLLVKMEKPVDGSVPMQVRHANVDGATIYRSKIFGEATGISFQNTKFLKADLSGLNFRGSNISGAEFDSYELEKAPETDEPDNFEIIFWRGYGRSERSINDVDEFSFAEELSETETLEQVRARYPADGFSEAWAWRDRAPKGIPDGVPGPILCDEKFRPEQEASSIGAASMPDECKPEGWEEPW